MKRGALFSLLCMSLSSVVWSAVPPAALAQYPNPCFIETGTFLGEGVQSALQAGFPQVYSVELSFKYYEKAKRLFKGKPNVHLVFGDSGTMLQKVIQPITTPITFWLDGYWSGGDTAIGDSVTSLMQELEAIRRHPIKTHTILIGGVHLFGEGFEGITLEQTMEKLKKINPEYVFSYEDGALPKDILVARVASARM